VKLWRKIKRNFGNILLLFFVIVLFIFSFEIGLRFMGMSCSLGSEGIYIVRETHSLKENFVGRFRCLEFDTEIKTNSEGFRDDEFLDEDIMIVGDSLVFGHGVEHDEIFTENLEIGGSNYGVPGYGPKEYLKVLEEHHNEKLVIVGLYEGNDAQENCGLIDRTGFVQGDRQGVGKAKDILKKFYIVRVLEPLLKNLVDFSDASLSSKQFYLEENDIVKECNLELEKTILEINNFGDVVFLIIPSKIVFFNDDIDYNKKIETILKICDNLNLKCLNGKEVLSLDSYLKEGHLNSKGHLEIANLINDFLIKENYVQ
jgi:hypothetical protein